MGADALLSFLESKMSYISIDDDVSTYKLTNVHGVTANKKAWLSFDRKEMSVTPKRRR